jgi:hypothetical protein
VLTLKIFYLRSWLLFCLILIPSVTLLHAEADNSEPVPAGESQLLLSLWEQALERQLSQHPYWLKLLHFYSFSESVGQWSFKSDVESSSFFLSAKGKTDPQVELKATIKALLAPSVEDPNQHARCKFIARFNWLQSKLDFPELPKQACPLFERWANLGEASGISIVFVSAYLKNPASIFGHLLIKFNSTNSLFGHSLLRPTLNYGAKITLGDNPFMYVVNGLFGGYEGSFTDERFYNYNHIYGENELRDLWEYPLNFTIQERERVTYHAWELLQNINFNYYFFLDNCAYRMAELLAIAWDDAARINISGALWSVPLDVVFKLQKFNKGSRKQPLLGIPRLIPSRQRKLQQRVSQLSELEQAQLKSLIETTDYLDSEKFLSFPEKSQARIVDAMLDYLQYEKKGKFTLHQQNELNKLLLLRSSLPILETKTYAEVPQAPTEGNPPTRFRFGTIFNASLGPALEVGSWGNYHDLLGNESGHLQNAEVVGLDLNLQIRETSFEVTQFQLFNIQKYTLSPSGIPGDFDWSWRARAAWERENYSCLACRQFRMIGGFGASISLTGNDLEYAFVDLFGETSTDLRSGVTFGYAPHLGVTWSPLDLWKIKLEGGLFKSVFGPKKDYFRGSFKQRLSLAQDWDIRLEVAQLETVEGAIALHYYW